MQSRLPSLHGRVIAFGHRGARAHAPENTIESFELALTLGATGLESDLWVTADGVAVLDHDGLIGRRVRRRAIADVSVDQLPPQIPTLAQLLELAPGTPISLDLKDPGGFEVALDTARRMGPGCEERLWLCHHDPEMLARWRPNTSAKLVNSTRLGKIGEGLERRVALLHETEVDALNMFHTDWTGGTVALTHRFGILAFGWAAEHERELARLVDAGIDAVYSDHVDRMVAVINQYY
jgi:glycerophosphoryl diester phosphodiesterase